MSQQIRGNKPEKDKGSYRRIRQENKTPEKELRNPVSQSCFTILQQ